MFHRSNAQTGNKRKLSSKLIAGFAALAVTTIITAGGFAAAASPSHDKPTKEWCKQAGFKNYGQCVKEWAHNKNKPGNGYGGGNDNSIITNISLALNNSNNNVIQIIINVFR